MRVGLFVPLLDPFATPDYLHALGAGVEARGFSSIWVPEHVLLFDDYASSYPYSADGQLPGAPEMGMLEPWVALSFLAAATSTVRLGTGICLVPQRNPVYLAKAVATTDFLSGGRVDLGVGVGWLAEEFAALDVPFERRGARTDEYLQVMRALWQDDVSEHRGKFYDLPPSRCYPKPVQRPHPPIYVGGESEPALRRVARHGDGWIAFSQTPTAIAAGRARIFELADQHGRVDAHIEVAACPYLQPSDPDTARAYRDAGVDELVLLLMAPSVALLDPVLDDLAERYLTTEVTG